MLSDYYGDQVCYAPGERADNKVWDCIPTVAEALRQRNDGGIVVNATGVTVQVTKRQMAPCIKGHPSVNKHTNHFLCHRPTTPLILPKHLLLPKPLTSLSWCLAVA